MQRHFRVAVDLHVRQISNVFIKERRQCSFFCTQRFHTMSQNPFYTGTQARQTRNIERPGFQSGGHLCGMLFIKAVYAAASHYQWLDEKPRAHIQAACSLRAKQRLMPGEA